MRKWIATFLSGLFYSWFYVLGGLGFLLGCAGGFLGLLILKLDEETGDECCGWLSEFSKAINTL